MDTKRIYIIKNVSNNKIEKQLSRAEGILNDNRRLLVFNNDNKAFEIGEIYECEFKDKKGNKIICPTVVMKSSGEYEPDVLVCPLFNVKTEPLTRDTIILGNIPNLDLDENYLAKELNLKTISKEYFKSSKEDKIRNIKPIGHICLTHIISILAKYKEVMKTILLESSEIKYEYECHDAYRCC